MEKTDTIVIGAGHAGLATSWCLMDAGREHVLLDRGRPAESWRSARWDSLRLLTPNWMSRLPGWSYRGADPEGFMAASEVVEYLASYAQSFGAPVQPWTAVTEVRPAEDGYRVTTTDGVWAARNVVIAAGPRPWVPMAASARIPTNIWQLHTNSYRNPAALPDGGVLVVGASASGVQIAAELGSVGRDVVLAVGSHSRLPRRYRGIDIMWWLEQIGALSRTVDDAPDAHRLRREPSLQLAGGRGLDLGMLREIGVTIAGRLAGADGHRLRFTDDLPATTAAAEARLRRALAGIDEYVESNGLADEVLPPEDIRPVQLGGGLDFLDLREAGISTVIWATGFQWRYPWLRVPVYDAHGQIEQYRGVTPAPGLYTVGLRFMHRRNSQFIDGVRHDVPGIVEHITGAPALIARR